jgi:hypothetical protein
MKESYEREHGNAGKLLGLVVLLASTLIPAASFAQTGDIAAEEVFFKVTSSELVIIAVIDVLLLLVLFYQVRLFKSLYNMTLSPEQAAAVEEEGVTAKKINKILTDAVDIEDEVQHLVGSRVRRNSGIGQQPSTLVGMGILGNHYFWCNLFIELPRVRYRSFARG